MQTQDFSFTKSQLLDTLNNWDKEPFTSNEYSYLKSYIQRFDSFQYGQDDIESLLLEILSDGTEDLEDEIINK